MSSFLVGLGVFALVSLGTLLGIRLQRYLPVHHRDDRTRDVVNLGIGMVAAMASLVLGLLIASVKGNFDTASADTKTLAGDYILINVTLREYGPDADAAIKQLQANVHYAAWILGFPEARPPKPEVHFTDVLHAIRLLKPADQAQTDARSYALQLAIDVGKLFNALRGDASGSVPPLLLIVLSGWLFIIFLSFGLFAPRNPVATITLIICAASIGGCVYLIDEMSTPFDGLIKVPDNVFMRAVRDVDKTAPPGTRPPPPTESNSTSEDEQG